MEELMRTPFKREVVAICVDPSPSRPPLPAWLKSVPSLMLAGAAAPLVGPSAVNNWLFERKMGGGSGGGGASSGGGAGSSGGTMTARRAPLAVPVYNPDLSARPSGATPTAPVPTMVRPAAPTPVLGATGKLPAAISGATAAEKGAGPPTLAGSGSDGPAGYHERELGDRDWSDMYSFLSHPGFNEGKGTNPIVRNFATLAEFGGAAGDAAGGAGGASAGAGPKRTAKEDALLAEFEAYTAKRDAGINPGIKRM